MIAEVDDLDQQVLSKPPGIRKVGMFSDDLVATESLLLSELVSRGFSRVRKLNTKRDAEDILGGAGENLASIGPGHLSNPNRTI